LVALEGHGVFAFRDQLLVELVEHLEERLVGRDAVHHVFLEAARSVGPRLAPNSQAEFHRARPLPSTTCSSAASAGRTRRSGAPCAAVPAAPRPCTPTPRRGRTNRRAAAVRRRASGTPRGSG